MIDEQIPELLPPLFLLVLLCPKRKRFGCHQRCWNLKWKGGIAGSIGGLSIGCARAIDIAEGVGSVIGAIVAEVVGEN